MIFTSKFINLELTSKNKTYSSVDLYLKVTRKDPFYFNRKGVDIYFYEWSDGMWTNETLLATWYTEYNPKGTDVTNPEAIIADFYDNTYQLSGFNERKIMEDGKRYDERTVKIVLKSHVDGSLIVEGQLTLETLPYALPQIYKFETETIGKTIKLTFEGMNPVDSNGVEGDTKLYRLRIYSTLFTERIIDFSKEDTHVINIPIKDGMYMDELTLETIPYDQRLHYFYAEYYLEGAYDYEKEQVTNKDVIIQEVSILKKQIQYRVPTFALGLKHITTEGTGSNRTMTATPVQKAYYKNSAGEWIEVVKAYQKIGGEWLSQE